MKLDGKSVLVIGGAGFIGSHVVEALLKTTVERVVVYDNFTRGRRDHLAEALADPRCEIFSAGGDIRDLDILDRAVSESQGVIHLAAMWLLHCKDYPRTAADVNIQGTFNVLEACARHKVERLVFSSSASVYGDALEVPMTEDHPFNNRNFYGATKIAGEAMCRAFHDRYGLSYVGLRYMNVYGPRQDQHAAYTGVIPSLLNKIDEGQAPVVNGDGSQAYDFIAVEDAALANVLALESDVTDQLYNVCTGRMTSIRELCDLILELSDSDLTVDYAPYSEEDSRRLVQTRLGSPTRAAEDLGFTANIGLEAGIRSLIKWRERQGISQ